MAPNSTIQDTDVKVNSFNLEKKRIKKIQAGENTKGQAEEKSKQTQAWSKKRSGSKPRESGWIQ